VCPHCKQFAKQRWGQAGATFVLQGNTSYQSFNVHEEGIFFSQCDACEKKMIWKAKEPIWPRTSLAPEAHVDFPAELLDDFEEARQVYNDSPRASTALLRLCLQKLCKLLGAPGKNINDDIQFLYDEFGLGRRVMDSMDILRVVGNNAVHPGEINLNDDREISFGLFSILNFIVEKAISEPAQIESIYKKLPEGARLAIESRVTKSSGAPGKVPLSRDG
jgi:hypothetical protein